MHISNLCDELVLRVLKHLSFRDIASIATTCIKMTTVSKDEELWTMLLYRDWRVTNKTCYTNRLQLYKQIVTILTPTTKTHWSGFAQWTEPLAHPQTALSQLTFMPGSWNTTPSIIGTGNTINRAMLPWHISDAQFEELNISWKKHVDGHTCLYVGQLDLTDGSLSGTITYDESEKGIRWSGHWKYTKTSVIHQTPESSSTDISTSSTTTQPVPKSIVQWLKGVFTPIK